MSSEAKKTLKGFLMYIGNTVWAIGTVWLISQIFNLGLSSGYIGACFGLLALLVYFVMVCDTVMCYAQLLKKDAPGSLFLDKEWVSDLFGVPLIIVAIVCAPAYSLYDKKGER